MQQSRTLFLGDLSLYCTEKEIFQVFTSFGPIVSIHLKRVPQGPATHLSYGFVRFQHRSSAEAAMISMQGALLFGRPLRVGWAEETRNVKQPTPYQSMISKPPVTAAVPSHLYRPPHAQIHVIFTSTYFKPVTEAALRQIFERFGAVLDVSLKRLHINKENGHQSGYGFIHYAFNDSGISAAVNAVNALNERTVDFINLQCNVSHGLARFIRERQETKPTLQDRPTPFSVHWSNKKQLSSDFNHSYEWNSSYDLPPSYRSSSNSEKSHSFEWLDEKQNKEFFLQDSSAIFPLTPSDTTTTSSNSFFNGNFSSYSPLTSDSTYLQTFQENCDAIDKLDTPLSYDYGKAHSDSPSTITTSITFDVETETDVTRSVLDLMF